MTIRSFDAVTDSPHRTEAGVAAAAAVIGVAPAVMLAVVDVEAGGSGFGDDGRLKMLFEAHVFHARTGGVYDQVAPTLSCPRWDRSLYLSGTAEYGRLRAAMALDEPAALESASWGLPQIIGLNHGLAGYTTAYELVEAFRSGEDEQLRAMARFIAAAGLADELRDQRWADFARGYNGPGYRANGYDTALAAAFARRMWAGTHPDRATIAAAQAALNAAGADPKLIVDGFNGPKTRAAVAAYQRRHGLLTMGHAAEDEGELLPEVLRSLGILSNPG